MEIVETGELRRIDYEKTEGVEVVRLFSGIYGVGECDDLAEELRLSRNDREPDCFQMVRQRVSDSGRLEGRERRRHPLICPANWLEVL